MKLYRVVLIVALATLLTGCSSSLTKDIKVEADSDPKANFSGYKSYAWWGSAAIVNDPYGMWEPPAFDADAEIKHLLDRELRKRGLVESNDAPDLIVAYAAGVDMAALMALEDPDSKEVVLENVPQGGLVVGLVDAESGFLIYAGVATADVQSGLEMDQVQKRMDYAVTQIIKQMPK